jgi:hypothetical protein
MEGPLGQATAEAVGPFLAVHFRARPWHRFPGLAALRLRDCVGEDVRRRVDGL